MELRRMLQRFQQDHPKFLSFLAAVRGKGIRTGSLLEIKITDPDGSEFISNIRLNEADMEDIGQLKELLKRVSG